MTRIFFDLDRTLYNTDAMTEPIYADMESMGHALETIKEISRDLVKTGYSFERHLKRLGVSEAIVLEKAEAYRVMQQSGDAFLYPGVIEGMARLATTHECLILTFGHPPFQEHKLQCIDALKPYIRNVHYVDINSPSKGEIIQSYGEYPSWFIDDSPSQLLDVQTKAPWTHCVRMMWPSAVALPHPGDGHDWPVVKNMDEFVALVEKLKVC